MPRFSFSCVMKWCLIGIGTHAQRAVGSARELVFMLEPMHCVDLRDK